MGGRRLYLSVVLFSALAAAALLVASGPAAAATTTEEPNRAGELATVCLSDLGHRTGALSVFAAESETGFSRRLFWQSERGGFAVARAQLGAGDLNADGEPDALVLYDRGNRRCVLYAFLSDGQRFTRTTVWQGELAFANARLCLADLDGNGLSDAYLLVKRGSGRCALYAFKTRLAASSQGAPARVTLTRATLVPSFAYSFSAAKLAAGDVDGDGAEDLVALYRLSATSARLDVFRYRGGRTTRRSFWRGRLAAARARLVCADSDGDGRADAVLLSDAGRGGSALRVCRSRRTAFAAPRVWWRSGAGKLAFAGAHLAASDLTADGRADVVLLSPTSPSRAQLTLAVSSGGAFRARCVWQGDLRAAGAHLACAAVAPTVVPAKTVVLAPTTVAGATTSDGETYRFSDTTETAGLAPGDVLVGAPTAALPAGIFRTVSAVSAGGARVETAPATLEDALSCGQFAADHELREDDFLTPVSGNAGVRLVRSRVLGADRRLLTFRLTDVGIGTGWDLGADLGPVSVSGTITVRITVHVAGKLSFRSVKYFVASETTTVASDLRATASAGASFADERTLATWGAGKLKGFTVWVGPVPLYFQPELSIFVGANGAVAASVTTSVHHEIAGTLGVRYAGGAFGPFSALSRGATYEPPVLSATGALKGYAGTMLALKLYSAAGPYVRLDAYGKLEADLTKIPWWTLKAGLEGRFGAQIELDLGMIRWDRDWHTGDRTLAEWTLATAPTPTPTPGPEFPICTAGGYQREPAISGDTVVWVDGRNDDGDIYGYDLTTGRAFPICTAVGYQGLLAISGDTVVWADQRHGEDDSDIYGYDLTTGREFPICTAVGWQWGPAISGDTVVWTDYRNDDDDIYGYDLTTGREFPICTAVG
ncbi:MAG TPA: FG-GAP-like repeat-containing protein, partial [Polyangiaceae bacterium]|nr:FG-GAP-like repeat-containing protein [Polyangiaceae bacterium]